MKAQSVAQQESKKVRELTHIDEVILPLQFELISLGYSTPCVRINVVYR